MGGDRAVTAGAAIEHQDVPAEATERERLKADLDLLQALVNAVRIPEARMRMRFEFDPRENDLYFADY